MVLIAIIAVVLSQTGNEAGPTTVINDIDINIEELVTEDRITEIIEKLNVEFDESE